MRYIQIGFLVFLMLFLRENTCGQNSTEGMGNMVNCNNSKFWTSTYLNGFYRIHEFELNNNTLNFSSTISSNCIGPSLAYSSLLSLPNIGFSLFSNEDNVLQYSSPCYWDTVNWNSCLITDTFSMINAGGTDHLIFYTGRANGDFASRYIFSFDGYSFGFLFATDTSQFIGVPDLATDGYGNIWFITQNNNSLSSNYLNIIDSNGGFINQYPFVIPTIYSYGLCIIQDTLYVGFGSFNGTSSHCLYSVKIDGDTAKLDQQIFFPYPFNTPYWADLASCNPGVPVGFKDYLKRATRNLKAYPNPASESITIAQIPNEAKELVMLNGLGAMVYNTELQHQNQLNLEVSQFPPGMYAVCVYTPTEVYMVKWIKSE